MIKDADMQPDKPTTAPTHVNRRFLWLVVVHIVVGWMGAYMAYSAGRNPTFWPGAFVGLMFSQTSLLGIWFSLGTSPWWKRVIGVVIGIGYLVPLLGIGIYEVNIRYVHRRCRGYIVRGNTIADRPVLSALPFAWTIHLLHQLVAFSSQSAT